MVSIIHNKMTYGDYLCTFFIHISSKCMPMIDPIIQNRPAHIPYEMFRRSLSIYVKVDAPVEKMIMYIPVADDTWGGTPKLSSNGLNILPPPIPSAPEMMPPVKAKNKSLNNGNPESGISDSVSPSPYLILSLCSICYREIEYEVIMTQNRTKTAIPTQSKGEQVWMPKILGFYWEPL